MQFESLVRVLKYPGLIIGLLILAGWSYYFFDLKLTLSIWAVTAHHQHRFIVNCFEILTTLGEGQPYVICLGIFLFGAFFIKKDKLLTWKIVYLISTVLATGLICNILKILVGRARPVEFLQHHVYGIYFWQFHDTMWSFPSGHSLFITGLATACSFLFPQFWGWFFAYALLIDVSRVIRTAHYLSDTLTGAYLGFLIGYALYLSLQKKLTPTPSAKFS